MIVFGRYFEAEIAGNRGGKVPENKPGERLLRGYLIGFVVLKTGKEIDRFRARNC